MTVSKTQATYTFTHIADQYVYSQTFGPSVASDDKWESTKGDLAFMLDLTKPRIFKHPLLTLLPTQSSDVYKYIKGFESAIVIIAPDSIDIEYYTSSDVASDAWCELTGICEREDSGTEDDDDLDDDYDADDYDDDDGEDDPIVDDDESDNAKS